MGRRRGVMGVINTIVREAAKAQRREEVAARRAQRLQIAQEKAAARQATADTREAKQRYLELRQAEASDMNADLESQIVELQTILASTLSVNDVIRFDDLRLPDDFPAFKIPESLILAPRAPVRGLIPSPGFLARLIPGASKRHQQKSLAEEQRFTKDLREYEIARAKHASLIEQEREKYKTEYEAFLEKVRQRNQGVDELERDYRNADPEAVVTYNTMVLEKSRYPELFPQEFSLAFLPESKELLVEYELPSIAIVPEVESYKYVKTSDLIDAKARKKSDIKKLYQDIIASIALRTVHEIFEADQIASLQAVIFNGFVRGVDPATGRDAAPHLISLRVTKGIFMDIDLERIDKLSCLRSLGANLSSHPEELQAVKPIADFNKVAV